MWVYTVVAVRDSTSDKDKVQCILAFDEPMIFWENVVLTQSVPFISFVEPVHNFVENYQSPVNNS